MISSNNKNIFSDILNILKIKFKKSLREKLEEIEFGINLNYEFSNDF